MKARGPISVIMPDKPAAIPQSMCPHGKTGRVFGWLMDLLNRSAHKCAVRRLNVQKTDTILEIGFGTGQLMRMLARKARKGLVAGVDPSELMVETAQKRNRKFIAKRIVEVRRGDASSLPWKDASFDKVAALHSFQFWNDPTRGLSEIARVLKPGGLLLLILRAHRGRDLSWLPNPASKDGRELAWLLDALPGLGFANVKLEGKVGSSAILTATRA